MGLSPKYNDLGLGRDMAWYTCPWELLVNSFNWGGFIKDLYCYFFLVFFFLFFFCFFLKYLMCHTYSCHRGQTWPSAVSRETKKEIQQQFKKHDKGDRLTWDHSIPVLHSLSSCIIGNLVSFWTSIKGIYLRNVFQFFITIYLEDIWEKHIFWHFCFLIRVLLVLR